jgi:hypothetical protein
MQNEKTKEAEPKISDTKAMLISFVGTALIAFATKIITLLLASEQFDQIINYLAVNYSFWFTTIVGSGAASFFARHFLHMRAK